MQNKKDVEQWLKKFRVEHYTINDDLTVDVDGHVNLAYEELEEIPIQFGRINGYFHCANNNLTSLKGCPREISGIFYCNGNKLTSLEGGPEHVDLDYFCNKNRLIGLKGSPKFVGGNFNCNDNPKLDNHSAFDEGPKHIGKSFQSSHFSNEEYIRYIEALAMVEDLNKSLERREAATKPGKKMKI